MVSQNPKAGFQIQCPDGIPLVKLPNRLSVLEAVTFKETCQKLCKQPISFNRLVLDFSQTTFIDSSGIGALVSNYKFACAEGIELILLNPNPQVLSVLAMTGLDSVFTVETRGKASQFREAAKRHSKQRDRHLPTTHPSVRSPFKRVIDIVGAMVGLGITTVLFPPIAIAIKLDSPGPIFFGQVRCGWMGRRFKMWKFRSMCVDAEARKSQVSNQAQGAFFKNENDPRITRVGKFLRRTSLDELPQFWNVLKGEMSLVGTRPPTPDEVDRYEVPEWQRLDVKPGMTGEWQVNGRSSIRSFEDVIELDLRYQKTWTFRHDIKLIFKTIIILFRKNSGAA